MMQCVIKALKMTIHELFMTEEMVEHTFKKYCAVNVVILKVYPTTSAKHKM